MPEVYFRYTLEAYCPSNQMRKSGDLLTAFQKKIKKIIRKERKKKKEKNVKKLSGFYN